MAITPFIIKFLAITNRGSITSGWINKHGASLYTEHKFMVTDLNPKTVSEVWTSIEEELK